MTAHRADPIGVAALAAQPSDAQIRAQLELPTTELCLLGADDRTQPVDGLNRYGFPAFHHEELIQFSSCTLTVPDGVALATAQRFRAAALDEARENAWGAVENLRRKVVDGLAEALELPATMADEFMLCPSGTDAEFLPVAVALHARGRKVRNIYVGAREAGRGVPIAGSGCWPGERTALGHGVHAGDEIDGIGSDLVQVTDVDVRDARGRARRAFDVEAEVEAHVEDGLSDGSSVIVHAMEGSKTGLRFMPPDWVERFYQRAPDQFRVVVDAAQGRIDPQRVQEFLDAGASVMLTGSKAWCGPPFSGVLIPSTAMRADIRACDSLPAGLAQSFSRADLPVGMRSLCRDMLPANIGLLMRWLIALDEVRRYRAIPDHERTRLLHVVVNSLFAAIASQRNLELIPSPEGDRSILTFAVRSGRESYLGWHEMTELHRRASAAGVFLGQPVDIAPSSPPMLRAAIGTATISRLHNQSRPEQAAAESITNLVAVLADELQTIRA